MNILTASNNDIKKLLKENINLFNSFNHVYLFGSSLTSNANINDIDLLVIYKKYSSEIKNDINLIIRELENKSGLPIDLTALTIEEEKEVNFLNKINHYLKLK